MKELVEVQDFYNAIGRAVKESATREALTWLERVRAAIEYAEQRELSESERDDIAAIRRRLAFEALEIQQRLLPVLKQLETALFDAAGKAAIDTACTGVTKDFGGGNVKRYPAPFQHPAEYEKANSEPKREPFLQRLFGKGAA